MIFVCKGYLLNKIAKFSPREAPTWSIMNLNILPFYCLVTSYVSFNICIRLQINISTSKIVFVMSRKEYIELKDPRTVQCRKTLLSYNVERDNKTHLTWQLTAKHHLQDRHIQLTPMFFFCLTIIFKLPKCISDSCVCVFSDFTVMSVEETAKIVIKTDPHTVQCRGLTRQPSKTFIYDGCHFVYYIKITQMDIFFLNF